MKVVVIGGTGLVGSKLVDKLRAEGHDAVPASPDTGVDTLTGEGLAEVLNGASVVVDVSDSPSFADEQARYFNAELQVTTLLPGPDAHITGIRFDDWLAQQAM